MNPSRDLNRLADMREALRDIRQLTAQGREQFESDRSAQQAVASNLAVLGEAARALSEELRERHPQVPWRDVIAQRNIVVHEYHRLDLNSIWATVDEDLPGLDQQLATIQQTESQEPDRPGRNSTP